jgi:AraC-like DNA-binding protein
MMPSLTTTALLRSTRTLPSFLRDAGPAQSPRRGPTPPPEWAATHDDLVTLARSPAPPPSWWKTCACFQSSIETLTVSNGHCRADRSPRDGSAATAISLYVTLAGWGQIRPLGEESSRVGPGKGFFAADWFRVSPYLPNESPGWTFARIDICHPYLKSRLTKQVSVTGPLVALRPDEALTASVVRLARGGMAKDFPDQFAAEMALFEFVLTFEKSARQTANGACEAQRLLDDVRLRVLARLPRAIEVPSLAADFGMSRSYFSHFFRERTGVTPAHFATEVRIQRVEQMLLATREPLKTIADACGFANANHLCKVFRRFRHFSPRTYRHELRQVPDPSAPLAHEPTYFSPSGRHKRRC